MAAHGHTPLMLAADHGLLAVVVLLLAQPQLDPAARSKSGRSAEDEAARHAYHSVVSAIRAEVRLCGALGAEEGGGGCAWHWSAAPPSASVCLGVLCARGPGAPSETAALGGRHCGQHG
jgi:hypothetical protein